MPKVRNYIVFYGDLYADDDVIPFLDPPRNPFRPGIYITRIPGIPKLDLHIETTSTEHPGPPGKLNYFNSLYQDGYTNNGNLIGNTVGRMGQAYQAWFTYWISERNTLQFNFKDSLVDSRFIPGGGIWQDYSVRNQVYMRSGFYLKSDLQYRAYFALSGLIQGPAKQFLGSSRTRLHARGKK